MSSGSDMIILSFNKNKWEWNGYFPVLNPSHKSAIWKKSKKGKRHKINWYLCNENNSY